MTMNLDELIEKAYKKILLPAATIKQVCDQLKQLLMREGNVRQVQSPVTVVGDVHGDYVDRGHHSVEVITLLACLKLRYPSRVTLVRGNHESRAVTATYGFYTECARKYGDTSVWTYFTDLFDYLILAAEIDNTILCVHGGLSPSIHTIDQIRVIDRFREIPHEGPMADLVWSDPVPANLTSEDSGMFSVSPRGAGYVFGRQVVQKFLEINALGHICRAHQICMEGYQIFFDDTLSTVWSAPNYCYRAGNLASILEIGPALERYFNVFDACPDSERDIIRPYQPNRLSELLDLDGIDEKKRKLTSTGQGIGHALFGSSDSDDTFTDFEIDIVGGDAMNHTIDQYFT